MLHATALPTPTTTDPRLYVESFLTRYRGGTREVYATRMRLFLAWCEVNGLDVIHGVTRNHIELYGRHLEDDRGNNPATVYGSLSVLVVFYRLLAIDHVIPFSPAEYVRRPRVYYDDTKIVGLGRTELGAFLSTARRMSPHHGALATLMGVMALRVSEACAVQIRDFRDYEQDHRVIRLVGKGGKPATMPLPPPVFRSLDECAGDRIGPLLFRLDGRTPLDRRAAYRMTRAIGRAAGIAHSVHPHSLRHSAITAALDAGVPLRDVQIFARHSDPRVTIRYDRARYNLDRHAAHTVSAYLAGAAA